MRTARFSWLAPVVSLLLVALAGVSLPAYSGVLPDIETAPDGATSPAAASASPSSAVLFVENVGQFAGAARFRVHGGGPALWLADDALWITARASNPTGREDAETRRPGESPRVPVSPRLGVEGEGGEAGRRAVALKLSFVGANSRPTLEPFGRLETKVSYLLGNDPAKWRPSAPVWRGVRYRNLYPGLDLEVSGEGSRWTWRFVRASAESLPLVSPSASLGTVRLRVEGATGASIRDGSLRLSTALGDLSVPLPTAEGAASAVPALEAAGPNTFAVVAPVSAPAGGTPPERTSAARASDLIYGTYLGGTGWDEGLAVAVDAGGAAYVTGFTASSDFPTTPGVLSQTLTSADLFVTKLSPTGSIAYSTFIGGLGSERGRAIAVDGTGAAFITGWTNSSDFPTTPEAFDRHYKGGYGFGPFVAKLNPTGTGLVYSTFLGGAGRALAVDATGAAYLAGDTARPDFPTTVGAFDPTHAGGRCTYRLYTIPCTDAFATKLNAQGSALLYSTFLGGARNDYGYGLGVDGSGAAVVTGYTSSNDFPTTVEAPLTTPPGAGEAFVARVAVRNLEGGCARLSPTQTPTPVSTATPAPTQTPAPYRLYVPVVERDACEP